MKRIFATALFTLSLALLVSPDTKAQGTIGDDVKTEKLAQTGFKFLSVPVSPRAAAMADALTAVESNSAISMFYNPAGMARLNSTFDVVAGQTQWIADIKYNIASVAISPMNGAYGVFGLSLETVSYGDIIGTLRFDNERGYLEYGEAGLSNPSPSALSIGLGYARALTDRFSVGGVVKYAQQDLDSGVLRSTSGGYETKKNDMSTVAVDFGVLYRTGFRSLNFAMSARNFSRELQYEEENFELPLTFRIGLSMDMIDLTSMDRNMHSLRVAVDAERPRDFAEQLRVGGEYMFYNTLAIRAGYVFPTDEQGVNLGVGLQQSVGSFGIGADYSYSDFGVFDVVHRVALHLSF